MRPRVFIASSVESIRIARAVQKNLRYTAETTVWDQGVFSLSVSAIDSLIEILMTSDFGVFVLSPDDIIRMRGKEEIAARDNVIFELGLFVGHLGKERCFLLIPADASDLHLPTDLIGMTPARYETGRRDNNLQAATGIACEEIGNAIEKLGLSSETQQKPEGSHIKTTVIEEESQTSLEAAKASTQEGENKSANEDSWAFNFINDNYEKALSLLEDDLSKAEDEKKRWDIKIWIGRMKGYISLKDGVEYFESLILERPSDHSPYEDQALLYRGKGRYTEAFAVLERGLMVADDKSPLLDLKATYLSHTGKFNEAISILEHEIKQNPGFEDHHLTLAQLYIDKEDKDSARKVIKQAIPVHPDSVNVLEKYGELWDGVRDSDLALLVFSRLVTLSPESSKYQTLLGNAYLANDLYALALEAYQKADEKAEGKEGWILGNIGNAYKNKGFFNKAIEYLKQAIALEPDSAYAHDRLSGAIKSLDEERKKADKIMKAAREALYSISEKENAISIEKELAKPDDEHKTSQEGSKPDRTQDKLEDVVAHISSVGLTTLLPSVSEELKESHGTDYHTEDNGN